MIFVDGHVHLHSCHSLDNLLHSSLENFEAQRERMAGEEQTDCVLLLAECAGVNIFAALRDQLPAGSALHEGDWNLLATDEECSLLLTHTAWPKWRMFLFAGRQIVTQERLEVLALATAGACPDDLSVDDTIAVVQDHDGMVVLPWGVGKWLGKRGEIISRLVAAATPGQLFVGDNGGRPWIWPEPAQFRLAASRQLGLLSGSDPLPLKGEEVLVGNFGATLPGVLSATTPAKNFKAICRKTPMSIKPFGRKMGVVRFFTTQVALRLKK